MSDLREKQPAVRTFPKMPAANFEVEISAWPYSGIKNEDVISRKLIYHIEASTFAEAFSFASVLRDTVQAIHDVWVAKIVCIKEWRGAE